MALPPSFLDELRARTPLPALVGRRVKLTRSSRDWKGCCPFHNEKSPSFYVYADHYHCFGCGAHGDAIGFVMQTQNAGFMEAVEQLAAEAGLDVPRPTPEAAAAEKRRADLNDILDAAGRHYQTLLHEPEGRTALDYLRRRGLTDETIRRFGLGYSGGGRGALAAEFARAGVKQPELVEAGLMKKNDDGRFVDFFFNRVMFPIRDARGRMISFGGRIIGDGQPKYLNGPETSLFSKRRNLYGLDTARADLARQKRAGARHQGLLVVEGYMDVIALAQAGFAAVAPLGTAITQEQVETLWQYEERPVFCFDGDAAGRRAGRRAIGLCLPLLTPEQSLGIVILPQGEDPDSLVTKRGPQGFAEDLARDSLETAIYTLLKDDAAPNSAESWAKFRDALDEAANSIPHKAISTTFWGLLRDRWKEEWFQFRSGRQSRPAFGTSAGGGGFQPRRSGGRGRDLPPPVPIGPRPVISQDDQNAERARVLLAILLTHPMLLPDLEEPFGMLDLPESYQRLRDALAAWLETDPHLDSTALNAHLRRLGYDGEVSAVLEARHLPACAMPDASPAEAAANWWQIYGFMRQAQLREEVAAKQREYQQTQDAETARQLVALTQALRRLEAGEMETG